MLEGGPVCCPQPLPPHLCRSQALNGFACADYGGLQLCHALTALGLLSAQCSGRGAGAASPKSAADVDQRLALCSSLGRQRGLKAAQRILTAFECTGRGQRGGEEALQVQRGEEGGRETVSGFEVVSTGADSQASKTFSAPPA